MIQPIINVWLNNRLRGSHAPYAKPPCLELSLRSTKGEQLNKNRMFYSHLSVWFYRRLITHDHYILKCLLKSFVHHMKGFSERLYRYQRYVLCAANAKPPSVKGHFLVWWWIGNSNESTLKLFRYRRREWLRFTHVYTTTAANRAQHIEAGCGWNNCPTAHSKTGFDGVDYLSTLELHRQPSCVPRNDVYEWRTLSDSTRIQCQWRVSYLPLNFI